jgi:transposase
VFNSDSQVLLDLLGKEFDGLLGCDYFSAYRKYMGLSENVRLQFCLAHLIRALRFLAAQTDGANRDHGEQLLALLRKVFSIIHRQHAYATGAGYRNALCNVRNELVFKAAMEGPLTQEASPCVCRSGLKLRERVHELRCRIASNA